MKINQLDMRNLLILRQEFARVTLELKEKKTNLEKLEKDLFSRIDAKAPFQKGTFLLLIETKKGAVRPKWKDEFAKRLGFRAVEKVIESI